MCILSAVPSFFFPLFPFDGFGGIFGGGNVIGVNEQFLVLSQDRKGGRGGRSVISGGVTRR